MFIEKPKVFLILSTTYTVVPQLSGLWLSEHLVIRTVSSQIPQSKYLYQHCSFQWFTEILQIAKMAAKCKCTV